MAKENELIIREKELARAYEKKMAARERTIRETAESYKVCSPNLIPLLTLNSPKNYTRQILISSKMNAWYSSKRILITHSANFVISSQRIKLRIL